MIDSRFSIYIRLEQRCISLFVLRHLALKNLRHLILKVTNMVQDSLSNHPEAVKALESVSAIKSN